MLAVAISITPILVMLFYRYPLILLALFPLVDLANVFSQDLTFAVGPFLLLPGDGIYLFTAIHLVVCALLQPRRMATVLRENVFVALFLGMVAFYVVRDTPIYGQSAIGEARKFYFMFFIPLLASVAIRKPEDLRRFIVVVVFAAACVTLFALVAAVGEGSMMRAVNAGGALIVALGALSMLVYRMYGMTIIHPMLDRTLIVLFSIVAIAAGHRSVWLVLGWGLFWTLWLYRARPKMIAKWLIILVAMVGGLTLAMSLFPRAGSHLIEDFGGIMDPKSDATASWRIEGWQQQLDQLRRERNVLFGEGIGGYYTWQFRGYDTVTTSPHNAYVQMLLKFGLFGLSLYGLVAFTFFYRALAVRRYLKPGPTKAYLEAGILNFAAAQAFCLGYAIEPIMLTYFACAVAAGTSLAHSPRVSQGVRSDSEPQPALTRFLNGSRVRSRLSSIPGFMRERRSTTLRHRRGSRQLNWR